MDFKIRPVWAEIDLDAVANNMREIKKLSQGKEIMAVVKADAYGHGAIDVAPVLLENGATRLAVAVISEALELRNSGIYAPILILGFTPVEFADDLINNDITQTVFNLDYAKELSNRAVKLGKKAKVHIAIDTGMGRIGFLLHEESINEVIGICSLDGLIVEGLFTHFSTSDEEDKEYTYNQFAKLNDFYKEISLRGVNIPIIHASNSGAIIDLPETYLDCIRPGIVLYGYYPSNEVKKERMDIKPVLTIKTKVVHVKALEKDMYVSYGRTFKTERESRIATLPLGYADGYSRLLSGKAKVIVNGKPVEVIGRICMDQCMIDVTDAGDVKVGDEVIVLGRVGDVKFDADDMAELMGTINYEILCDINHRIPRAYIKNGQITKVRNYI